MIARRTNGELLSAFNINLFTHVFTLILSLLRRKLLTRLPRIAATRLVWTPVILNSSKTSEPLSNGRTLIYICSVYQIFWRPKRGSSKPLNPPPPNLRACICPYSSFLTQTSQRFGCICTFCLLFHFLARLLALSFSLPSPFCCRNNETASATTALKAINLHKCTQIFVNRYF